MGQKNALWPARLSVLKALIKKFTFIQSQNTFFKEAFKEDDYNSLTNYDYRCIYDFYKKKIETIIKSKTYTIIPAASEKETPAIPKSP